MARRSCWDYMPRFTSWKKYVEQEQAKVPCEDEEEDKGLPYFPDDAHTVENFLTPQVFILVSEDRVDDAGEILLYDGC